MTWWGWTFSLKLFRPQRKPAFNVLPVTPQAFKYFPRFPQLFSCLNIRLFVWVFFFFPLHFVILIFNIGKFWLLSSVFCSSSGTEQSMNIIADFSFYSTSIEINTTSSANQSWAFNPFYITFPTSESLHYTLSSGCFAKLLSLFSHFDLKYRFACLNGRMAPDRPVSWEQSALLPFLLPTVL